MSEITQSDYRKIIEDFANEIRAKKSKTSKPSKAVINFRRDRADSNEREIFLVPIDLLRFRKENGRIASDVLGYEKTNSSLIESDEGHQKILGEFLQNKDPEKTSSLLKSIRLAGQQEPAIITCDGFLIDGNRRKMVMDQLRDKDNQFNYMKVVILPGEKDDGGPPSLVEIEQIENRYQLHDEGKSEYYGFDRAITIRRKKRIGMLLEEQLLDDPRHAGETVSQIKKEVKKIEKEYLNPLECVDRFLNHFGRPGQYHTISSGVGDPEGRWQAFVDYSNTYAKLKNRDYLLNSGIEEDEIGDIEESAFNIIRLRHIPGKLKVHQIMRDLHKYCAIPEGKKEILQISKKIEPLLPDEECFEDSEQKSSLPRKEIDEKWVAKNKENIIFHWKRASDLYENQKDKETPIGLLDATLKKLRHPEMDLASIRTSDYGRAKKLISNIQREANTLEKKIYEQEKKFKRLGKKSK